VKVSKEEESERLRKKERGKQNAACNFGIVQQKRVVAMRGRGRKESGNGRVTLLRTRLKTSLDGRKHLVLPF